MMDERLLNMEVQELARRMKKARAAENNKRKTAGSRELTQGDIANIIQQPQ